ncbi:non-homologous end joining protein Ku [Piscinibacter terrae]|uniref:Non-homologous end joining protein Ku n=1 Tax=Piscinibacter terrae TaxID=2496871 RepID=A0A3N7JP31_9BURK|nr:Ku protein [Albitalea terrae]RQP22849.1 Ku protein [Albitalea terrae]
MATSSTRTLWKGAISFGLVHIPVALHSATADTGIDFDWLDKRSMDPVGYKRINKKTGKEIDKENIVKGVEYESGHYVVLTDEEIKAAYPKSTQTIEIEAFVPMNELPFVYLDRPYYLSPLGKGDKVYALLRETLLKTGRVGIARVVIQTRQHLAALIPSGPALVLNLVRWGEAIRPWDQLNLPEAGTKAVGLKEKELSMAEQLVDELTTHWDPDQFHDTFSEEIMKLVHQKVDAGQTETVIKPEAQEEGAAAPSNVVDLTELLQRSLRGGSKAAAKAQPAAKEPRSSREPKPQKAERAPLRAAAASRETKSTAKARAPGRKKAA